MAECIGKEYGYLTVIKQEGTDGHYHKTYLCRCVCGNTKHVTLAHLKRGTPSCGCKRYSTASEKRKTHGMSKTRLYHTWQDMKARCYRKTNKDFQLYGGRGITVCNEWKDNFQAFHDWALANGYTDDLSIDRRDSNGNYEPSNCRWVSQKTQCNNYSRNHLLTYQGVTRTMAEWADITGIPYTTLRARINLLKWDVERALKEGAVNNEIHSSC